MARKHPWAAYALRLFCSGLMFVSGYGLLTGSTFALRMRNDAPVDTIFLGLAAFLAFLPLLFGRKYLGAMLVSAFMITGIGGYWWTTIPWDEFIKDSGFPSRERPDLLDYALVASPAVICAFYAIVSRASVMRADLRTRGADGHEATRAACASFLAGSVLLIVCGAFAFGLWALMAGGLVFRAVAPLPTGVPALVIVAALVTVAYALLAGRLPRFRAPPHAAPTPDPRASDAPVEPRKSLLARRRSKKALQ